MRKFPDLKVIEGWESMQKRYACPLDLPLAFDYGCSWRHGTGLDEPFCRGSLKTRTLELKIQKEPKTYCFMANLLLTRRVRKEKEQMYFEHLRLIMLKLSFKVISLCLLVNLV